MTKKISLISWHCLTIQILGGQDSVQSMEDSWPAKVTEFYQIKTNSWIKLANTSQSVWEHQMAILDSKPIIIGGGCIAVEPEDPTPFEEFKRNTVQTFNLPPYGLDEWSCCIPQLNFKRSKFSAVTVPL